MRAPGQSVAEADLAMQIWIANELGFAKQMANSARVSIRSKVRVERINAYFEMNNAIGRIGKAQHPVADSTSPAHAGLQVWGGLFQAPRDVGLYLSRETAVVYNIMGAGTYTHVKRKFEEDLYEILKE
ncbi:MAG: hypothetical protein EOP84_02995 [Verrucomicrobiaceae bacterium]|nr:MAG: hypothetical protein EOP84_02995 [Verrucomicrobiaceae bacterium]